MTRVRVTEEQRRRPFDHHSFIDLVPALIPQIARDGAGRWVLDWPCDLTPEQVDAVTLRLTTPSDDEAAARVAAEVAVQQARAHDPELPTTAPMLARKSSFARIGTTATDTDGDGTLSPEERIAGLEAQVAALTVAVDRLGALVLGQYD